jgi:hypothetical protein
MIRTGNFLETPFTDVISSLQRQGATGTLTCTAGGYEKTVCLKSGQVIFAASQDMRDRLGEIMVATGQITRSQLERALELHRKSAGIKKIGAVMVENGFVTPKDLFNGLKHQVRSIIHGLILLTEGTFRFTEALPPDVIPLQINMEELLREVIQQVKKSR